MSWALFELARNPECQSRLRDEIKRVKQNYDNKITYEALLDMDYLNQVFYGKHY